MYNAELGRFTARDPLGYVDGMSVYEYVQCSPFEKRDPLGLSDRIALTSEAKAWGFVLNAGSFLKHNRARLQATGGQDQDMVTKIAGIASHGMNTVAGMAVATVSLEGGWDIAQKVASIHPWLKPIVEGINLAEVVLRKDGDGLKDLAVDKVKELGLDKLKDALGDPGATEVEIIEKITDLLGKGYNRYAGGVSVISHKHYTNPGDPGPKDCRNKTEIVGASLDSSGKVHVHAQGQVENCGKCYVWAVSIRGKYPFKDTGISKDKTSIRYAEWK
jgi:hypothetical protein